MKKLMIPGKSIVCVVVHGIPMSKIFFSSQSVISFLGYLLLNYHFSMVTERPKIGNDSFSVVYISLGIGYQDQVLGMFSHERDPWPSGCG